MKKVKGITNRIVAMLMSGMLAVGAVPGTVLASENQADIGQTSEIAAEVPEVPGGADSEEVSAEAYSEDAVAQEVESEAQYYTVILDANGGYFENEWDDVLGETVEKAEVVEKHIPVDGNIVAVPVFGDQDGRSRTFAGWSLERDGELVSQAGEEYNPLDNCVLYAIWDVEDTSVGDTESQELDEENTDEIDAAQDSGEVETAEGFQDNQDTDELEAAEESETDQGAWNNGTAEESSSDENPTSEADTDFGIIDENEQDVASDQEAVYADEDAEKAIEDSSDAAEEEEETQPELNESSEEEETVREDAVEGIVESGTNGNNITWTLDEEGTLTISGTGNMTIDWMDITFDSVKSIVIEEGVTSIGYGVFQSFSSMTSVTIPDSVTSIRGSAFSGCSSLTSVVIPDGVTSIENTTFAGCESLTSVTIPDSVTSIGYNAFQGCSSLTSVAIPDSVTSIQNNAFSGAILYCGL